MPARRCRRACAPPARCFRAAISASCSPTRWCRRRGYDPAQAARGDRRAPPDAARGCERPAACSRSRRSRTAFPAHAGAAAGAENYRAAFIAKFALQPLPAAIAVATATTPRAALCRPWRAARPMRAACSPPPSARGGAAAVVRDPTLHDRARRSGRGAANRERLARLVRRAVRRARERRRGSVDPARMEYAVSVRHASRRDPQRRVNLSATEFDGGDLDWSSFDCDLEVNHRQQRGPYVFGGDETTVPAPVTLSRSAGGAVLGAGGRQHRLRSASGRSDRSGAPDDDRIRQQLRQRLVRRAADAAGRVVTRVDSLVVTDTFGVRSLLRPIGAPGTLSGRLRNVAARSHPPLGQRDKRRDP